MLKTGIAIVAISFAAGGTYLYMADGGSEKVFSDMGAGAKDSQGQIIYTLENAPFRATISSIGELRASRSSTLTSPYSGKVIKILPEGTRVEVGDPVVWFETEEIEQEFQNYEAQLKLDLKDLETAEEASELEKKRNELTLESEKITVNIARQSFQDSKQKYDAEQVLFDKNISPQTKLDEARLRMLQEELNLRNAQINLAKVEENLESNLRVKQRDIEKAQLRVDKTQEELDEEQEKLEESIIYANNPGDISYLKIWKSGSAAKIAEGDQVWRRTNLVEIPDTTEMLSVVPISEVDIGRIDMGQQAWVELEAIPGRIFEGKVSKKSSVPITDSSQRSWEGSGGNGGPREFEVSVVLAETDPLFRQGMTSTAEILIYENIESIPIPIDAIVQRGGQEGLFVVTGNQTEFRNVTVSRSNESFVLIEPAMTAGTKVLLNPPDDMRPALATSSEEDSEIQTSAVYGSDS